MRLNNSAYRFAMVVLLALVVAAPALSQVNSVNLSGNVIDPQNLAVVGAKITVKNLANGATQSADSDDTGHYEILGLAPGHYSLTVEAKGMATSVNPDLSLTLGVAAQYDVHVTLAVGQQTVTVTGEAALVDTSRTAVSETIRQRQIDNLPINGRNYINFTLLTSQVARDTTPSIGAAPTSGLNFGGQRARSNEVSVDGADAVDNSVNGIRATVSQEAVQEFQVQVSNYMPEFGRATGGVVNIVTKSGGNDMHGDAFGFFRHKDLQARNPFSVEAVTDPATGELVPQAVKQGFTRVQAGATLGGAIEKDKTFYFLSYELTRREESGFTDIGTDNFGLVPSTTPALPGFTLLLTPQQRAFVNNPAVLSAPGGISLIQSIFALGGSGSNVAVSGIDPGLVAAGEGVLVPPGPRFPLPIDCGLLNHMFPCMNSNLVSLPASFVPLTSLIGNYPIKENTDLYSARLDHIWNSHNTTFIRASASPSFINGIQVNAENQNFGQNAGSRTSLQDTHDFAVVGQHVTNLNDTTLNEFRFQFARRALHYGFSDLPGGSNVAVNITGTAFFGREPFSTEDRIERRFQWTDNLSLVHGSHTFKIGIDTNLIQLRTYASQTFELNFGGVYTFGDLSPGTFSLPSSISTTGGPVQVPNFSAVQAYGLGLPTSFIQGIGHSRKTFDNNTVGPFFQDSWRINHHLTLNYGLRYDVELSPIFSPGTPANKAGEAQFGVVEGIPNYYKAFQPRIALAWDPTGSGKTVIRAGYGIFYDHPALALAFLATAEDGALSTLLEAAGGIPSRASLDTLSNFPALNASSIFQGVLSGAITGCSGPTPTMCYQANQQRFNPLFPNSLFANQNFLPGTAVNGGLGFPLPLLPFTIPVEKNFVYGYAQQANLAIERDLGHNLKISVSYNFTHALHLDRTRNINVTNPALLVSNASNAQLIGLFTTGSNPLGVAVPGTPNTLCGTTPAFNIPGGGSIALIDPGVLGSGFTGQNCTGTPVGFIGSAAAFNFFRPSGPNPSFAALAGGFANLVGLARLAGFPGGTGTPIPWSDVNPQESSGNSLYSGLTVTFSKRFSNHFEMLSSWTYSHTIDDSTDLSTLLNPQDNNLPLLERSNSDFDQRHRWITSAVFQSPYKGSDGGWWRKVMANFTVAPVIEVASGRPYDILLGSDPNLDFGTATNRPSVAPPGTPIIPGETISSPAIPGVVFTLPNVCLDPQNKPFGPFPFVPSPPFGCFGNLGRNAFNRPGFFTIDLRVSRRIPINERWSVDIIADGFNMLNRFNTGDVSPLCDPSSGSCTAGVSTAALDPRQFQLAVKLYW
ncbi:MAG TPA: TonB-dependent receptor [Candidatus Acidoferrales bacterium]|nr:TonB-dependent receptor [Candidatus Acidoferrales bacterium]